MAESDPAVHPDRWGRRALYLLVACAATVSAEALSWSTPLVAFDPFVVPLYGLHYVVLLDVLARRRALSWPGLAVAGVVLGFTTESVLTKVIWNPPWDAGQVTRLFGLGVYEVGFIVVTWHAWMSLALPVALVLSTFGVSRLLAPRRARLLLLALPLAPAFSAAIGGASIETLPAVVLVNGALVALAALLFDRFGPDAPDASLLVLSRRERGAAWVGLLAFYSLGLVWRTDAWPTAGPLVLGLALVAASIALFVAVARATAGTTPPPGPRTFTYRRYGAFVAYMLAASAALVLVVAATQPASGVVGVLAAVVLGAVGVGYVLRVAWRTVGRPGGGRAVSR